MEPLLSSRTLGGSVRILLCGVLAALPLLSYVPEASARVVTSVDLNAVSYWTPARIARATPLGARTVRFGPVTDVPVARSVEGSRVIGALFFNNGSGGHYCTASVIRTPKRNM